MKLAAVVLTADVARQYCPTLEHQIEVTTEGHVVSVTPAGRGDIAKSSPFHAFYLGECSDQLYEECIHPLVTQLATRQRGQACVVVDGSDLGRYHLIFNGRGGILRKVVAQFIAHNGNRTDSCELGLVELNAGDAFVDVLEPRGAHPPHIVDDVTNATSILHGLKLFPADEDTLCLIERLHNPNRHQVTAVHLRLRGGGASAWLYIISLALRERFRSARSPELSGAVCTGPFRGALQHVTAAVAAPQRPATIPFSQSKLTHLLKPCLCDEIQPGAWIVPLVPSAAPVKGSDGFADACLAIGSAARVAATCKAMSFPRDVVDVALSPQSTPGHSPRGGGWLSPGGAAVLEAVQDHRHHLLASPEEEDPIDGDDRRTATRGRSQSTASGGTTKVTSFLSSIDPAPSLALKPVPLQQQQQQPPPSSRSGSAALDTELMIERRESARLRSQLVIKDDEISRLRAEVQEWRGRSAAAEEGAALQAEQHVKDRRASERQLQASIEDLSKKRAEADQVIRALQQQLKQQEQPPKRPADTPTHASNSQKPPAAEAATKAVKDFEIYRATMEPTLRRLRHDAERRAELVTELEKQLRVRERVVKRLEGEAAALQREVRSLSSKADRSESRTADDTERVLAEVSKLQGQLREARSQLMAANLHQDELQAQRDEEADLRRADAERLDAAQLRLKDAKAALSTAAIRIAQLEGEVARATSAASLPPPPTVFKGHANTQTVMTTFDISTLEAEATVDRTQERLLQNRVRELEAQLRQAVQRQAEQESLACDALERVRTLERDVRHAHEAAKDEMRAQQPAKHPASVQAGVDPLLEDTAASARLMAKSQRNSSANPRLAPHPAAFSSPGESSPHDPDTGEPAYHREQRRPRSAPRDHGRERGSAAGGSVGGGGGATGIIGNFRFSDADYQRVELAIRNRTSAVPPAPTTSAAAAGTAR